MARPPGPLGADANPGLIDPGTCARTHHRPPRHVCATRPTDAEIAQRARAAQAHLVRLVLWGGSSTPGDNSAFEFAARNVSADYTRAKGKFALVQQRIKVAQDIVTVVKKQAINSIRSLGIFTHGGPQALYLTTADANSGSIARYVLHNSSLYRGRARMYLNAAGWTDGSALVGDSHFTKFTANAKIELHGCRTAEGDSASDNMPPIFPSVCGRQASAQPM